MTKILARKKNGKKCQSVTGFKNVEGALSKHLNIGLNWKSALKAKLNWVAFEVSLRNPPKDH